MDTQYYPTPLALALKAWRKFKNRNINRLLEPNAGRGDLLAPLLNDQVSVNCGPIDMCEIDAEHHPYLQDLQIQSKRDGHRRASRELNIVGYDFLTLQNGAIFSHVIMNPPFLFGAQHVLKAWDLVWNAEIVAIINAETIRNAHTNERKRLINLIHEFGDVEFVQDAFVDGERGTPVEIALIYLNKNSNLGESLFEEWKHDLAEERDTAQSLADEYKLDYSVVIPATQVENKVAMFNLAVKEMQKAVFAEAKANNYAELIGKTMSELSLKGLGEIATSSNEHKGTANWVQMQVTERYMKLKDRAWANILRSISVTDRLSSKAQQKLEREFQSIIKLEFTVANIYGFLTGLSRSQDRIQIEMACDVFDAFMTYHTDNAVYYKGWRSNDKHRSCGQRLKTTRLVHPGHHSYSGDKLNWNSERFLADIDKVFAMLDGKNEPEVSLISVFSAQLRTLAQGERLKSSYFDIRYYPRAGTIHFFASNKEIIDRLNRVVGKHRRWLPPNESQASKGFWEMYNKAEVFNADLRAEVKKHDRWGVRDPFTRLTYAGLDEEERAELSEKVDQCFNAVFAKHGITTDDLLCSEVGDTERGEQLLLAEPEQASLC